jgi:sulfonate transport system substrate-binding protein
MRATKSLALAIIAGFAALAPARAEEPVKIRAAWINTPASLIQILFDKPGLSKHQGVSYQFEPIYFASSPTQVTAIASGELEIATLNFTSIPFAVLNAGLTDLRIIADETQDGFGDYNANGYMVLNDGPVKKIEDLKGKTIAVIGIGAGTDIGMRSVLVKHGLEYQRDYNLVEARLPNMQAMLAEHKVDLITGAVPFSYNPELLKIAHTLFYMKDGMGTTELSFWLVRADFIAKHRAALVDLMEDMVRSYRWYGDPANHAEAIGYLARATKLPASQLDSWAFTKKDYYRDPNGLPDLAGLQRNINTVKALGFIKSDVDVMKISDLSLVKEGAARVK